MNQFFDTAKPQQYVAERKQYIAKYRSIFLF